MISSTRIRLPNNRTLVEYVLNMAEFPSPAAPSQPFEDHWVFLMDVSGSMWSVVQETFETLCKVIQEKIPDGGTVSVFRFSGRGQVFPVITNCEVIATQHEALRKRIMQHASTIGLTCFSEVLNRAKVELVDAFQGIHKNFNLVMFTDGSPTEDSNSAIFKALEDLKPHLNQAVIFGYGPWTRPDLLASMARAVGGIYENGFDSRRDFSKAVEQLKYVTDTMGSELHLQLPEELQAAVQLFTLNGTCVLENEINQLTKLFSFRPSTENASLFGGKNAFDWEGKQINRLQRIYAVVEGDREGSKFAHQLKVNKAVPLLKAHYAWMLLQIQNGQTEEALEAAYDSGDVGLVRVLRNAVLPRELGRVEDLLRLYLTSPKKMRGEGVSPELREKEFSTYSLLDLLMDCEREGVHWYPYLKDAEGKPLFQYRLTSRPSVVDPSVPVFVPDPKGSAPVRLVVAEDKPSVSLTGSFPGQVQLDAEEAAKFNLLPTYKLDRPRTYTLVCARDGKLDVNVSSIVLGNMSTKFEDSLLSLRDRGLISFDWVDSKLLRVDLTTMPLTNRKRSLNNVNLRKEFLLPQLARELQVEAKARVFRWFLDQVKPVETRRVESFGKGRKEGEIEFLQQNGIDPEYGYRVPTNKIKEAEPTDQYQTIKYKFNMPGLNSWTSVADLLWKMQCGKDLTANELLQEKAVKYLQKQYNISIQMKEVPSGELDKKGKPKMKLEVIPPNETQTTFWAAVLTKEFEKHHRELESNRKSRKFMIFDMVASGSWFHGFPKGETVDFADPAFPCQFQVTEVTALL